MKSIREKSEEYAKTKHTDKNLIDIVSWDFEAGANYVLEEIEQLICEKHVEGNLPLFDLTHLIDKLKENSYGKRK